MTTEPAGNGLTINRGLVTEILTRFIRNEIRVMTATNAFGMGVDKDDVRLVVHMDMPSSLEAYLQEAGRAGRDGKPAAAILLWAPGDAEPRFSLAAMADLSGDDLRAIWRAIQQLPAARLGHSAERGRARAGYRQRRPL